MKHYMNKVQSKILYEKAKMCKSPILEFGSLRGASATAIAKGSKAGYGVPLYCVDTFAFEPDRDLTDLELGLLKDGVNIVDWNVEIFNRHMAEEGVKDIVKPVAKSLYDFEYKGPVGMIFVDADKKREGLNHLWNRFWEQIDPGGWFILHDFKYGVDESGGQKRETHVGHKEWFIQHAYPKHSREWRYGEINHSMLLIRRP